MPRYDVARYRASLLSDDVIERRAISRTLAELSMTQHADFVHLCRDLLDDSTLRVRREILWHLRRFGDSDDAVTEAKVVAALAVLALRARAVLGLGTVGTEAAFPMLYAASVDGEMFALEASARQARTPEQRQQVLRLSRVWLFSETYAQREEALRALRLLSTAQAEEDVLLRAYLTYGDELVVWAIGGASARMLPILRNLLRRWPVGCAEYNDVRGAIRRLESRLGQSGRATLFTGQRALDEYL
jgi:hypothetical protein